MSKIKDALGMGHHSHSSSSTSNTNCPECTSNQSGSTGSTTTTANYGAGANIDPSLASRNTTTSTTTSGTLPTSSNSSAGYGSRDNAMTRSEEQMLVGKERVDTGGATLKKTLTTEHVETSVPLVKEKVMLQREPITEANRSAAMSGPDLKEAEHVVTTSAERPVVQTETVPKERVHLGKVAEVSNQTVGGDIRKEQVSVQQGGAPVFDANADTSDPLYNKDNKSSYTNTTTRKHAY